MSSTSLTFAGFHERDTSPPAEASFFSAQATATTRAPPQTMAIREFIMTRITKANCGPTAGLSCALPAREVELACGCTQLKTLRLADFYVDIIERGNPASRSASSPFAQSGSSDSSPPSGAVRGSAGVVSDRPGRGSVEHRGPRLCQRTAQVANAEARALDQK